MWIEKKRVPFYAFLVVLYLQVQAPAFALAGKDDRAKGLFYRINEVLVKGMRIESGEGKICIEFKLINGITFGKKKISGYLFVLGRLGGESFSYPSGIDFDKEGLDFRKGRPFSILWHKPIRRCVSILAQKKGPLELTFIAYSIDGSMIMKKALLFEFPPEKEGPLFAKEEDRADKRGPKGPALDSGSHQKLSKTGERSELKKAAQPITEPVSERPSELNMTPEELFRNGKLLIQRNQLLEANEYFKPIADHFPESEFHADSLYFMGNNFLALSKFEEAAEYFDAFVKRYPNDERFTETLLDFGFSLESSRQFRRARSIFDRVRPRFPDLTGLPARILLSMVRTYHRVGEDEVFLEVALRALNLLSDPSQKNEVLHRMANVYESRGKPDAAMKVLSAFLFDGSLDDKEGEILVKVADLWKRNPRIELNKGIGKVLSR